MRGCPFDGFPLIFNGGINRHLIDLAGVCVREDLVVVDNQGLDDNGVLATVSPVNVPAGRSDEVGSPDYGEVAGGHAGGVLVV